MKREELSILAKENRNASQLADMTHYTSTPIAIYTHTTNKEAIVSAVDVDTNTFTSVAHGLNNNERIYPIVNENIGNVYPYNVYAGGLSFLGYPGYYVINKTNDTFQVSLSSGGAAVDLTTNANIDLTKWHFEKLSSDVSIANLPENNMYKVIIKGKNLQADSLSYLLPNSITMLAEWIVPGTTGFSAPPLNIQGDISIDVEILVDYKKMLTISAKGTTSKSASASTIVQSTIGRTVKSPKYYNGLITSLNFNGWNFANGTVVEVYKA